MHASSSLFAQLLQLVPKGALLRSIQAHQGERCAKGFTCRMQLVAMLYLQLAFAGSLGEICDGLRIICGKLLHLGLGKAPAKSSLAYANEHRSYLIYRDVFYATLQAAHATRPGNPKQFRFKSPILTMDASIIELCATLFPWAHYRRGKGAAKLHLVLDHDGYLPVYARITDGKTAEVTIARTLRFPRGSVVMVDRGYEDYTLFQQWTDQGIRFVTRLKANTVYKVHKRRPVPKGHPLLVSDEDITLSSKYARALCTARLRRVVVHDPKKDEDIALLTNALSLSAATIGQLYKERWQVEILFRELKQNLRVKSFVGTSYNALALQIWTALLALLLLAICRFRSQYAWSLSRLVALLRVNLFTYRSLRDWLVDPFGTPPLEPPIQLTLAFQTAPRRRTQQVA